MPISKINFFFTRYHFGTICYGTSILGIFQLHKYMITSLFKKYPDADEIASWITKLYLLLPGFSVQLFALSITIIEGTDYKKSIEKAYDSIMKNPKKYLILTLVSF